MKFVSNWINDWRVRKELAAYNKQVLGWVDEIYPDWTETHDTNTAETKTPRVWVYHPSNEPFTSHNPTNSYFRKPGHPNTYARPHKEYTSELSQEDLSDGTDY